MDDQMYAETVQGDQGITGAKIGTAVPRIEGRSKVTGEARYPADEPVANTAYAYLVTSAIARGTLTGLKLDEAKAVPGVLDILTHENVGDKAKRPPPPGGQGGKTTTTLESDRIWHDGQIIAVVVAESFEAAREAAFKVVADYDEQAPSATFDSKGADVESLKGIFSEHESLKTGDADTAFEKAAVKIDARYSTPTQHHNPIELFSTTCFWEGGKLTVLEPSQSVSGFQSAIAQQLGLEQKDVRVVSKLIGGAFGSKGGLTARTAWIAIAAQRLNRPVKLVASRDQGFTIVTYRAETRHRIRLAADRDGKIEALIHEAQETTSRPSTYNVSGTDTTAILYNAANVSTKVEVVHTDRNTPGFMRAPPETPYMFPLESAMDELAVALKIDPVELRRINDTDVDVIKQRTFTSRSLMKCFDQAAERFGWARRNPQPGSMTDGDWLVGWGCATAAYPVNIMPCAVRLRLSPDGQALVQLSAQDIGNGAYTVIALTAADKLGLPIGNIKVDIGDSDLPPGGIAAGSNHTASICNGVAKACEDMRVRIAQAAAAGGGIFANADPSQLAFVNGSLAGPAGSEPLAKAVARVGGMVEVYAENVPDQTGKGAMEKTYKGKMAMARGDKLKEELRYSFGAQFVEVRVHRLTREIRVSRAVGAFAAGRIMNPLTAYSQLMGGMIWGIGAALLEATEIDERSARYMNDNLGEYLIAVNADIGEIDVIMVPEEDTKINPLGIKGVGELGIVGMNAAVANAVYHATGIRVRDLPIRIESLLG